jgi:2-octaprenyl-6-methoxyphenol hydroxylase
MSNAVVIVGGGPVGATLALALAQKGIAATMLEARNKGAAYPDGRALALSYGSKMILQTLGVWDDIAPKATEINTIHISQKGSFGRSILKAYQHGIPSLGYVVSYGILSAALDSALAQHPHIEVLYQAEATSIRPQLASAAVTFQQENQSSSIDAQLAVLADGGRSLQDIAGLKREVKAYGHDALVSKVECELAHQHIAYERFTPMGPMALLPNGERDFSLVWTGQSERIQTLLALDDAAFLKKLHDYFGDRVGRFLTVGKRMSFPLKLAYLDPVTAPHLAVIGNAAQTMHPVAGQGFNVGLRDAFELAQLIANTTPELMGESAMLQQYQQGRKQDTQRGLMFTDFLVNTFSNDIVGLSQMRSLSLGLFDMLSPAKKHVVNKMSFGA